MLLLVKNNFVKQRSTNVGWALSCLSWVVGIGVSCVIHPPAARAFSPLTVSFRGGGAAALYSSSSSSSLSEDTSISTMDRPFGAWESSITSKAITAGSVRIGDLFLSDQTGLNWLEGRPQEGGRSVICRFDNATDGDGSTRVDVTPKESNVRTRVHEYGGGAVVLGPGGGELFVSDFTTQQLCQLQGNGTLTSLTPPPPPAPSTEAASSSNPQYRYADGVYDPDTETIYCVRENHGPQGDAKSKDVVNEIVAIHVAPSQSATSIRVIVSGNDFYAAPRLSPDCQSLAFVTWNHPNMPWDATELQTTSIHNNNDSAPQRIAGSVAGDDSILQPLWHPQTGALYYLSDESGYYNLYRAGDAQPVQGMDLDWGGAAPGWVLGQQGYTFLQDGRLAAVYRKDGSSVLLVASLTEGSGQIATTDSHEYGSQHGLPMMFGGMTPAPNGDLYFIGGSPSTPTSIYRWNLERQDPAEVVLCSSTLSFDEGLISVPQQVEFPTKGDRTAFGYYYPPKNLDYHCTTEKAPPLLVKAHGGPTACTGTSFNPNIQFWTSRGFAVLDVDYGGSTGYGRAYRRRLRKSWGIVDVDDVCAGAQYLVDQGLADGNRLCIDGGSAGGYTTLGALAFRSVFKAGCSLYGIGDLTALAGDTHKFESRYLDGLVGPYPQDEAIYKERSPIESVETLSCPILLLQGEEDKIVPPNQARMMHEALLQKGIPTCLKVYKGEQHGFRKAENIEDALDSELAFYGKVFGIEIPGAVDLAIDNLS